jgi:hypothetical protein
MRFGVREVTDIVFRSISNTQLGGYNFTDGQPVIFIDSAKMSTLETTVATVYAQGGRGNPRLLAWDGDKTATFKFEDALVSPISLSVLSSASSGNTTSLVFHQTQRVFIPSSGVTAVTTDTIPGAGLTISSDYSFTLIKLDASGDIAATPLSFTGITAAIGVASATAAGATASNAGTLSFGIATGVSSSTNYLIDYYVTDTTSGTQIQVDPAKFGGYYYLEANTLFRGTDGKDYPAQITIPKAKIKTQFTLTMSPTGEPTNFSFEADAMPGRTKANKGTDVLYEINIGGQYTDNI